MDRVMIDDLQQKAIEILSERPEGLSYRELLAAVFAAVPGADREAISQALGELPRTKGETVWRPKPGHFKIRAQGEGPSVYARGRKRRQPEDGSEKKVAWPERPLPNRIENLLKIGFEEVGSWQKNGDGIECVYPSGQDYRQRLLAYSISGSVVFIGRPQKNLPARAGYVNRSIRNAIAREKEIKVYALTNVGTCEHFGMSVNIGAGIEDELIERMQPPWNNYPA